MVVEGKRRVENDRWRLGDLEVKRTNKYLGILITVNGFDKAIGGKRTKALKWWMRLDDLAK